MKGSLNSKEWIIIVGLILIIGVASITVNAKITGNMLKVSDVDNTARWGYVYTLGDMLKLYHNNTDLARDYYNKTEVYNKGEVDYNIDYKFNSILFGLSGVTAGSGKSITYMDPKDCREFSVSSNLDPSIETAYYEMYVNCRHDEIIADYQIYCSRVNIGSSYEQSFPFEIGSVEIASSLPYSKSFTCRTASNTLIQPHTITVSCCKVKTVTL